MKDEVVYTTLNKADEVIFVPDPEVGVFRVSYISQRFFIRRYEPHNDASPKISR